MGREWGGALRTTENVSCMRFSSWFCHTLGGDVVNGEKLSFILSKEQ